MLFDEKNKWKKVVSKNFVNNLLSKSFLKYFFVSIVHTTKKSTLFNIFWIEFKTNCNKKSRDFFLLGPIIILNTTAYRTFKNKSRNAVIKKLIKINVSQNDF